MLTWIILEVRGNVTDDIKNNRIGIFYDESTFLLTGIANYDQRGYAICKTW